MANHNNNSCYEIMLNYTCNAKCVFCSQGSFDKSLNAPFEQTAKSIYLAWQHGFRRIGFTGGEPLISKDILKAISLAHKVGFRFIRVQTNGIKLADSSFCKVLAEAGLTLCKFSFASDIPVEHDKLVGVQGAFEKAVKGLKTLRSLKVRVSANILITKLNYFRLADILRSFLAIGVRSFVIIYPDYIGSMSKNYKELGISLSDCSKYFDEASKLMENLGLGNEILFLNVPACFLSGRESLSIGLSPFNTFVSSPNGEIKNIDDEVSHRRVHVEGCKKCRLKSKCLGLERNYVDFFGSYVPVEDISLNLEESLPQNAKVARKHFLSENEECLFEILKDGTEKSTADVLAAAEKIALCRDCTDGNSVMNTGLRMEKQGLVSRRFFNGKYYWKLN